MGFSISTCLLVTALIALTPVASAVFWNDLRVIGGDQKPSDATYIRLPRSQDEALARGWKSLSDAVGCENKGRWRGFRYIPGSGDSTYAVLYDVHGVVAGLQALFPYDEMLPPHPVFRFDLESALQNETIGGRHYSILTAYFVNPKTICTTGRSISDLHTVNGTGNSLWFQFGPSAATDVMWITTSSRAQATLEGWEPTNCVPTMGWHNFYRQSTWEDFKCTKIFPFQLLFNNEGKLHGFVFQVFAPTTSKRMEHPPWEGIEMILGKEKVPPCLREIYNRYGFSTMHVYFVDKPWEFTCTKYPILG